MLKRTGTALLLFMLALFTACDNKEECIRLDNEIAAINDTLMRMGSEWGDELEIAVNTLDFSHLQPIRQEMVAYIDRKIEYVKKMENVGGSEELLKTELQFLQVEREIINEKFAAFEQFTDSVAMDELSNTYASMQLSALQEQELLEKLHKLREEYAEKNDIPKFIDKH